MSSANGSLGHLQEPATYRSIFLWLLVLTVITVVVSRFEFGQFNTAVALAIAALKASLVVRFFMHGRFESKETWAFIAYPLIVLVLLIGFLLADYAFRPEGIYTIAPVPFDPQAHSTSAEHQGGEIQAPAEQAPNSATPPAAELVASSGDAVQGRAKAEMLCIGCHLVEGKGNALPGAPVIAETQLDDLALAAWLKEPGKVKPGTVMPAMGLSDQDVANLMAWIRGLKSEN
jgi:caa(3)-type oxidase subunit IV